jgi:uncharacterized membrane protein YgcG
MPLPAHSFRPDKAHCPSCLATLPDTPPACPFCDATFASVSAKFPFPAPPLSHFIDPENRLDPRARSQLEAQIATLEAAFPQLHLCISILQLPEGVDAREFSFWFFNSAPSQDDDDATARAYSLLLLIDRNSRRVAATVGYGLDPFLGDPHLSAMLAPLHPHLARSDYQKAISTFLSLLLERLGEAHREAAYIASRYQSQAPDTTGYDDPAPRPDRDLTY